MIMPRKPAPGKRSKQLNIYLQPATYEAFQAQAEQQGVSMSTLVAELIEGYISGAKNEDQRIVVPPDVVMAVVRQVLQEGFEIRDKFAPTKEEPPKPVQPDNATGDDDKVPSVEMISSANLAPQKISSDNSAPKTRRRKVVYRAKNDGGDGDVT